MPSERDYRNAGRGSASEHANGQFSHQRLFVDAALSRDHEVGAGGDFVEPHCVQQQFSPGNQLRIQVGQHPCSHASCCSGASDAYDAPAAESFSHRAKIAQPVVESLHHGGVGALLRSIYIRRPVRSAERVDHVAGGGECGSGKLRERSRGIHGRDVQQGTARAGKRRPACVQKPESERRKHPGAAVVGGASAESDDHAPAAAAQRVRDHLPGAEGRGQQGIAFVFPQQGESACGRHVDDCRASVGRYAILRTQRTHQRVVCLAFHGGASERLQQSLHRPFSAVGHVKADDLALRKHLPDAQRDRLRHLSRRQRTLERIRRHDDFSQLLIVHPLLMRYLRLIFSSF